MDTNVFFFLLIFFIFRGSTHTGFFYFVPNIFFLLSFFFQKIYEKYVEMNISFFLFHTKKIHDRATADDDDNNDDGF